MPPEEPKIEGLKPEKENTKNSTINDVLIINKALNGEFNEIRLNKEGTIIQQEIILAPITRMENITEGKYSITLLTNQINEVIKGYEEQLKDFRKEHYDLDENDEPKIDAKGNPICKEGKTLKMAKEIVDGFLKQDCGIKLKTLPLKLLEKHPKITPKHLEYLFPILV